MFLFRLINGYLDCPEYCQLLSNIERHKIGISIPEEVYANTIFLHLFGISILLLAGSEVANRLNWALCATQSPKVLEPGSSERPRWERLQCLQLTGFVSRHLTAVATTEELLLAAELVAVYWSCYFKCRCSVHLPCETCLCPTTLWRGPTILYLFSSSTYH
ncbi:hypothetical protein J6590_059198 [Homalodisca vitripennis]|nr:hypothetical protein J6590_059198 [Homalodisca vitripennis]